MEYWGTQHLLNMSDALFGLETTDLRVGRMTMPNENNAKSKNIYA